MDTLFTDPLTMLRLRRANCAAQLAMVYVDCATCIRTSDRLKAQYKRTFYKLTAVECNLYERIGQ